MRRVLFAAALTFYAMAAGAQDFRPFPQARISEAQWQSYYDEVRGKYSQSARFAPNQPLVVFDDGKSTQYVFTQPGHPAHPSWVARRIVDDGGRVKLALAGYFAGDEKAFAELFQAYATLTPSVREYIRREGEKESQ